jgi:hypothetical protein
MRALVRFPALLLLLAIGCHSGTSSSDVAPSDQTRAKIENRSSLDMDITVTRNDGRSTPLGRVPSGETTSFALPVGVSAGAAWVRFQATPVRGSGESTTSEPFPVKAGNEISWSISPQ